MHTCSLLLAVFVLGCSPEGSGVFVTLNGALGPSPELSAEAEAIASTTYADRLAHTEAIAEAADWIAETDPDVVVLQDLFDVRDCELVPADERAGFVCEEDEPPSVARQVLGDSYTIACHDDNATACIGVHSRFGVPDGCEEEGECLDGAAGDAIEGCPGGARVGRVTIPLVEAELTMVNVQASEGMSDPAQACRIAQFEQIWLEMDEDPAANGDRSVVFGSFETDPARLARRDVSAARLIELHEAAEDFLFVTRTNNRSPGAYRGTFDLDHMTSNFYHGACLYSGIDDAVPSLGARFDHPAIRCELTLGW